MTAQLIDGKSLAQKYRMELSDKLLKLKIKPTLAVIQVGNNPASEIYVRNKEKACQQTGINSRTFHLADSVTETELTELIYALNQDKEINGILVQLPLPPHINEKNILSQIDPIKDVDGFHTQNVGLMVQQNPQAILPCTPKGIIHLIKSVQPELSGLTAIVIGRSQIVGLPTAHLLVKENCTVTVAHSKTKDLSTICSRADILVAAIGKPEYITKEFIKKGAIIIDVGINRTQDGLKGDVCYNDALPIASYLTPVPGGVGPMTIAMLLENTVEAFLKQSALKNIN